jgi:hypothetical protein
MIAEPQPPTESGVPHLVLVILAVSGLLMVGCCGTGFALAGARFSWVGGLGVGLLIIGSIAMLVFVAALLVSGIQLLANLFRR